MKEFTKHRPIHSNEQRATVTMAAAQSPLQPFVRKLLTLARLSDEDQAAILALPYTSRKLDKHGFVVREGEKPTHCCLLVSGFAIRTKIVCDGARQIVNIHVSGDMVDLQNSMLGVADHNVQALTTMEAAFIPREALVELAFSRPSVGKALWIETLVEGAIQREWIANVGRRNALQRVAHLLCEFAYRLDAVGLGKECNYELPMTQEQLADTTGLTPVHLNRTLKRLDENGLTKRSRRSVTISDFEALAEIGDFRPLYLHLPPQAPEVPHRENG
jgi:CRP-like cAMP-binding protein